MPLSIDTQEPGGQQGGLPVPPEGPPVPPPGGPAGWAYNNLENKNKVDIIQKRLKFNMLFFIM